MRGEPKAGQDASAGPAGEPWWRPRARLVSLSIACAVGCGPAAVPQPCDPFGSRRADGAPGPSADLSALPAYRSYAAVTYVGPAGHHFTIWSSGSGMRLWRVRAEPHAEMPLLHVERSYWGSLAVGPSRQPAMPRSVRPLAEQVRAELAARCEGAGRWLIAHEGESRMVMVEELIAHDSGREGRPRTGRSTQTTLFVDAAMTRVLHMVDQMGGRGLLHDLPADAQWLALAPKTDGTLLTDGDGIREHAGAILDAARRHVASGGHPAPTPTAVGPRLPADYPSQLTVEVELLGHRSSGSRARERSLRAALELHELLLAGRADGAASVSIGGATLQLLASLVPDATLPSSASYARREFSGRLSLSLSLDGAPVWSRQYPVSGTIETEEDRAIAPYGLRLPGASSPSPEADALHARIAARGTYASIDAYVQPGLSFAARKAEPP